MDVTIQPETWRDKEIKNTLQVFEMFFLSYYWKWCSYSKLEFDVLRFEFCRVESIGTFQHSRENSAAMSDYPYFRDIFWSRDAHCATLDLLQSELIPISTWPTWPFLIYVKRVPMTTICIKSISTTVKIGPNHYYYFSLVVTTVIKSYSNTSDYEVEFRTYYLLQNRKTGQLSVFSTFSAIKYSAKKYNTRFQKVWKILLVHSNHFQV